VFREKSMTRAARLPIALAAASCGGLLAASSAPAAPPATVPEAPASAPADPLDRLDQLVPLLERPAVRPCLNSDRAARC